MTFMALTYASQPLHHLFKPVQHLFTLEVFAFNHSARWSNLFAGELIPAAVDGVQQTLRQVCPRAEELHLLPDPHRRHTARDRAIIAPRVTHDLVAFKLNRTRVDGDSRG